MTTTTLPGDRVDTLRRAIAVRESRLSRPDRTSDRWSRVEAETDPRRLRHRLAREVAGDRRQVPA